MYFLKQIVFTLWFFFEGQAKWMASGSNFFIPTIMGVGKFEPLISFKAWCWFSVFFINLFLNRNAFRLQRCISALIVVRNHSLNLFTNYFIGKIISLNLFWKSVILPLKSSGKVSLWYFFIIQLRFLNIKFVLDYQMQPGNCPWHHQL